MKRLGLATLVLVAALAIQPLTGWGSWTVNNTGSGTAVATWVLTPAAPTVTKVGANTRIAWLQGTLAQGTVVTSYIVRRTVGATSTVICTVNEPARYCNDTSPGTVPATYTVTNVYRSWTGSASPGTTFTHDTIVPVTTLSSLPAPNAAGWNTTAPTLTLTATDAGSGVSSITYKIGPAAAVTVNAATTSFTISATGNTTITYYATDVAGNVESTKTYTVRLDTVAPAAPTAVQVSPDTGSSSTDGVTSATSGTLSGTAEPNSTVELRQGATVLATTTAGPGGAFSFAGTMPEGSYPYTLTAIDDADNRSIGTAFTVRIDTRAPTLSGVFPANGGSYSNGQLKNGCVIQDSVCGTVADPAYSGGLGTVRLRLTNSAGNCLSSGGTFTAAACSIPLVPTGTTAWNHVIGPLTSGTYTLRVTVTDLAGNVLIGTYAFTRL